MGSARKLPNPKRANAPLRCDYSKAFAKDRKRIERAGRQDLVRAKRGMLLLIANDGPLDAGWLDHALTGELRGCREFHAGGDLLVLYERTADAILFARIGTHAELFE